MRYKPHELSLEEMRNLLKEDEELAELIDSVDGLDEEHDRTPGKISLPFVSEEPVHEACWER